MTVVDSTTIQSAPRIGRSGIRDEARSQPFLPAEEAEEQEAEDQRQQKITTATAAPAPMFDTAKACS
jgi:hypothetical protein